MSEHKTRRPLGLDASEVIATQSRAALMRLDKARLFVYRWPVQMSNPVNVDSLRAEFGDDAELPDDDATHCLVIIKNAAGEIVPMLIPEADVRPMALMAAVMHSMDVADRVTYRRGMFPVGAVPPEKATEAREHFATIRDRLSVLEMSNPVNVDALRAEFGDDAELPDDDGMYHLGIIENAAGEVVPMLIPESDVRPMALMAAVLQSMEQAARVTYRRGMFPVGAVLPTDNPPAGQA